MRAGRGNRRFASATVSGERVGWARGDGMTNEARVYFRDVKPYEVPGSLDELLLPRRVRELWEERFPELRRASV